MHQFALQGKWKGAQSCNIALSWSREPISSIEFAGNKIQREPGQYPGE